MTPAPSDRCPRVTKAQAAMLGRMLRGEPHGASIRTRRALKRLGLVELCEATGWSRLRRDGSRAMYTHAAWRLTAAGRAVAQSRAK